MNNQRVNEIISKMKAFTNPSYQKQELLDQMLLLQSEMVDLTFKDELTSSMEFKIWDVDKRLKQMNYYLGNVADKQLEEFIEESRKFDNLIKAEISGKIGENKAFKNLKYLRSNNIILKNIELSDEYDRTELDAIVITSYGITIVEVKNTAKNIFISERGNYYRTGEYLKLDCNLAKKMTLKENLLRKILPDSMKNVAINNIVVFTNSNIEVHNKCEEINTCFVSQLTHFIENFKSETYLSLMDMEVLKNTINQAQEEQLYVVGFDVDQLKYSFANLIATLETASMKATEETMVKEVNIKKPFIGNIFKKILETRFVRYATNAVLNSIVITSIIELFRK